MEFNAAIIRESAPLVVMFATVMAGIARQLEANALIGYLSGVILHKDEQTLLLNVNGVGYEVFLGDVAAVSPGAVDDELSLYCYTYVREDQITLYGFKDLLSKTAFNILIAVNGIGPKLAMAVISRLSPAELVEAVTTGDLRVLRSVPGVGKKMAERMILELKDKLAGMLKTADWTISADGAHLAVWQDLAEALGGLGFSDTDIQNVITLLKPEFDGAKPQINELLKLALQKIKR